MKCSRPLVGLGEAGMKTQQVPGSPVHRVAGEEADDHPSTRVVGDQHDLAEDAERRRRGCR